MRAKSLCHPSRNAVDDGDRCRECRQTAPAPPDAHLPAMIYRTIQHAGPELPERCYKCGGIWAWDVTGDYALCPACGSTWHRTSRCVMRQPRDILEYDREVAAMTSRKGRLR